MDDLLKEAIADAKAVRETALENAKMALEEAFTPRLQNMLSQKIQNEIEDEDDDKKEEDVDLEERDDDDDMEERSMMKAGDEDPSDDHSDDDMDESNIIEIDGVKYAPVVEKEDDEDPEEGMHDDEDLEEREDDDYKAFFKKAMKKFNVTSVEDMSDEDKKDFFNYVDRNYKAKNEIKQ